MEVRWAVDRDRLGIGLRGCVDSPCREVRYDPPSSGASVDGEGTSGPRFLGLATAEPLAGRPDGAADLALGALLQALEFDPELLDPARLRFLLAAGQFAEPRLDGLDLLVQSLRGGLGRSSEVVPAVFEVPVRVVP